MSPQAEAALIQVGLKLSDMLLKAFQKWMESHERRRLKDDLKKRILKRRLPK